MAKQREMRFEIYRDRAGEFRWRIIAANGRKIGGSGGGYKRRGRAMLAAARFAVATRWAPTEVARSAMTARERAKAFRAKVAEVKAGAAARKRARNADSTDAGDVFCA